MNPNPVAAIVGVCCCVLLLGCCWISRDREDPAHSPITYSPPMIPRIPRTPRICQTDLEGPAQSPPTYNQPSYPQQPYIIRIGAQYPSIQPLDTLSTPQQYTTPGKHKPDTEAPPPYSNFQHEAAGVLGLKRGQQTKN